MYSLQIIVDYTLKGHVSEFQELGEFASRQISGTSMGTLFWEVVVMPAPGKTQIVGMCFSYPPIS